MTGLLPRIGLGAALVAVAWCLAWCLAIQPVYAANSITDPAKFLDETESLRLKDHPRYVQMLAQIHHDAPPLSEHEQWHLRYLDTWEAMYEGEYPKAEPELHQIIDHSGDPVLVTNASTLFLKILFTYRRYAEAFALANHLASTLPEVKNPEIRYALLVTLSQMHDFSNQFDLALQYARMAEHATPPGTTLCLPLMLQAGALYNSKRLTSTSPELHRAIDVCTADHQPVLTSALWLYLVSIYLDEGQPAKALALLNRVAPTIQANHYYEHMLSSRVHRAQIYLALGDLAKAKSAAMDALAISQPSDTSTWLMNDYEVLYEIEKKQRHETAALVYHERYSDLVKSHLDDLHARALAYDMAEQHLLVQNMQADELSKQNHILQLKQVLATKAVETSRLYITLLSLLLISVVAWMFRLKRSQLRFKELSSLDALTGIFNHQHFKGEADRALHQLEKRRGVACLIAIDLDHFKQINDTNGHALGDIVLKRTVTICRQHLRPQDLFGRLGGEEFRILLPNCHRDQGIAMAEHIRTALEAALIETDGGAITFSASLGVACTDTCGYDLHSLCRDAGAALHRAKQSGRNQVMAEDAQDGHLRRATR
ncbi:MAG TPA: diguanylate cyclase [Dyella sp.]|uniref:tetratricopeptide repeat-containing diguanylate cyclase n=1 Tax=Dyella sp. TaxID=1869338 RepID=UPI002BC1F7D3|nr:diguanylate cyclase [Dyella sp.]HUB90667.1 diguanylate cyclase [Dyella sp.]